MTLLVGVLCEHGAVIASDRQASHGVMGNQTVGLPVTKVRILGTSTLFASSGPIGLSQQYAASIEPHAPRFGGGKYHGNFDLSLQKGLRQILNPALETAGLAAKFIGNAVNPDVLCQSLLAARFQDGLKLIEISPQAGFEVLSKDIPFVCQGSGKQNADPFLRYLWSVYFSDRPPSLQEAILVAYWTVKVAIDLKSPMVGFTPDVFVLDAPNPKAPDKFIGRQVNESQLLEHSGFIKSVEDAMRSVRDGIVNPPAAASTEPPTMPTT